MLVSMAQILNAAREGGYGVTAPNIHDEDAARAGCLRCCGKQSSHDFGRGLLCKL